MFSAIYTLSGNDPSIGGLLLAVFSADTFIIPEDAAMILPNLSTCVVGGEACMAAALQLVPDDPARTEFSIANMSGSGLSPDFLTSSFGAFGT